jgi:hypothetical protein
LDQWAGGVLLVVDIGVEVEVLHELVVLDDEVELVGAVLVVVEDGGEDVVVVVDSGGGPAGGRTIVVGVDVTGVGGRLVVPFEEADEPRTMRSRRAAGITG